MRRCCVPGCQDNINRRYFIPAEKRIQDIWIQRIGNPKLLECERRNLSKNHCVCAIHFAYICKDSRDNLLRYALPTLNLPAFHEASSEENCFSRPPQEPRCVTPEKVRDALRSLPPSSLVDSEEISLKIPTKTYSSLQTKQVKTTLIASPVDSERLAQSPDSTSSSTESPRRKDRLQRLIVKMSFESIEIDKICRTCLSEESVMRSIFSIDESIGETMRLVEMLMACAAVQVVENDGLPNQVCLQCVHYITRAFSFKQLCERSDATLRQLLDKPLPQEANYLELKPLLAAQEAMEDNFNVDVVVNSMPENLQPTVPHPHTMMETQEVIPNYQDNLHLNDSGGGGDTEDQKVDLDFKDNDIKYKDLYDFEKKPEISVPKESKKRRVRDDTEQPIYPCEQCTQCFTTVADLKAHKRTHSKPRRHECNVCNQCFASASTLCRHMKVHGDTKRHLCSECGKGFARSDDLKRHIRTHTGERPFQCKLCNKAFAQSFRLLEHMRAHADEKNFICAVCGKAFSRYTSLAAHNKTHSGIKTHTCEVCGKKLCGAASLAMHLKTHTGVRDHICPYCGKGFTTPSNLNIHKRTHTGERPYVCNDCGKGFPDPSRLTVHARTHSGEKPYVCEVCKRGCVSSSQLKKHMRIHTGEKPYLCTICPKAFPRSEDLRIHVKTHTGDRNHVCHICKKGFYQSSTLKVHLRIHTGEKPYACSICEKSFSQTGPLSTHMRTHY